MAHSFKRLSSERQAFVRLIQRLNFGRLDSLEVMDSQPVLEPPPRQQWEIKFGGEIGPRTEHDLTDFAVKQQLVELFSYFDELQNGVIDVLEIKHGLPFRMVVSKVPN